MAHEQDNFQQGPHRLPQGARRQQHSGGETGLRYRMRTHLIPYAELAVGYEGLSDEERRARVKSDYVAFIEARAELLAGAAQRTCTGQSVELSELFHEGQ